MTNKNGILVLGDDKKSNLLSAKYDTQDRPVKFIPKQVTRSNNPFNGLALTSVFAREV